MRQFFIISFAALALSLGGCDVLKPSATVPTVKAQQTVDALQSLYKASLDAENIYLAQTGCTRPAAPPPPLCASYAVGMEMKRRDEQAKKLLADAQKKLDTLGSDPAIIDAAIAAARLAIEQFQTYTLTRGAAT